MENFIDYIEFLKNFKFYQESAEVMAINVQKTIECCEKLSATDKKRSYIYEMIAENLSEAALPYDYSADSEKFRREKEAEEAKRAEDYKRRSEEEFARRKAEKDRLAIEKTEKEKADAERLAAREARIKAASVGKDYSSRPEDLMSMIQHVGAALKELKDEKKVSQDFSAAIDAIYRELNSVYRREIEIPETEEAKKMRIKANEKEVMKWKKNTGRIVTHNHAFHRLSSIIHGLYDYGLDSDVDIHEATLAYRKLHNALMRIKRANGDYIHALNHWIQNGYIEDRKATDVEKEIMPPLLKAIKKGFNPIEPSDKLSPSGEIDDDEDWMKENSLHEGVKCSRMFMTLAGVKSEKEKILKATNKKTVS